jgi:hypothetical protein
MVDTVMMFGTALLSTPSILRGHGLLARDSPIRKLGLMICLFVRFGSDWRRAIKGWTRQDGCLKL